MYIISSFQYSTYLELAITELESKGIAREKILVIPLDKLDEKRKLFDSINYSDGISLFDTAAILGTIFMVLGVIYGYVWRWGPIIWGLIGLAFGVMLGFLIDIIPKNKFQKKQKNSSNGSEVIIIINCANEQSEIVESIFRCNHALGIGRYNSVITQGSEQNDY